MWAVLMHLREFRLFIHSRYISSLQPYSLHTASHRESSPLAGCIARIKLSSSLICRESTGFIGRLAQVQNPKRSPITWNSFFFSPSADLVYKKRCLCFNAPNFIDYTSNQSIFFFFLWIKRKFLVNISILEISLPPFSLLVVCLSCKWACLFFSHKPSCPRLSI